MHPDVKLLNEYANYGIALWHLQENYNKIIMQ